MTETAAQQHGSALGLLERFGVLTDEVHPDLETALQVIKDLGLRYVELLAFWGKPVVEMDAAEFCRTLSGRGTGEGLLATQVPF